MRNGSETIESYLHFNEDKLQDEFNKVISVRNCLNFDSNNYVIKIFGEILFNDKELRIEASADLTSFHLVYMDNLRIKLPSFYLTFSDNPFTPFKIKNIIEIIRIGRLIPF